MRRSDTPLNDEQRRLVEENLGIAYMVSNRSTRILPDDDERESAAILGLLNAARGYDPESGYKFSTYAAIAVRRAIIRAANATAGPIRIPYWIKESRADKGTRHESACREAAGRLLGMRRRDAGAVAIPADGPSPLDRSELSDDQSRLRAAIGILPPIFREAIEDRLEGLTLTEAGARRGLTDQGAGHRYRRALALLRQALAGEEVAA